MGTGGSDMAVRDRMDRRIFDETYRDVDPVTKKR